MLETQIQDNNKIELAILNCNLRDKLFRYIRPLLGEHISSEQVYVQIRKTTKNGVCQRT